MKPEIRQVSAQTWVLPAESVPVRLMNTVWADRYGVHDALGSEADLSAWLLASELSRSPIATNSGELAQARRLRDALRRLAAFITQDSRSAAASPMESTQAAIAEVNAVTAVGHIAPSLLMSAEGLARGTTPKSARVLAAFATVAAEAIELFTRDIPLRACQAPGCVLYFVKDHPRRQWCSDGCGNRARAARHYRRHSSSVKSGGHESGEAPQFVNR